MKIQTPLTVIVVAGLTVGAVWLFNKPAAPEPQKVAEAPKVTETPPAPATKVAAPTLAPAPKPAAATTPADPAKASADPQAQLSTAIPDIVNLIQSGDIYGAFERYAPPALWATLPPEQKAQMQQQMQQEMARPEAQQDLQMVVQVLQSMQSQAPAYNAAGDQAVYQISDPTGRHTDTKPFSFQKIDGKWYVSPDTAQGGF